jgi:hypothetical protein
MLMSKILSHKPSLIISLLLSVVCSLFRLTCTVEKVSTVPSLHSRVTSGPCSRLLPTYTDMSRKASCCLGDADGSTGAYLISERQLARAIRPPLL